MRQGEGWGAGQSLASQPMADCPPPPQPPPTPRHTKHPSIPQASPTNFPPHPLRSLPTCLQVRPQVGAELAQRLAGGPANLGVRVGHTLRQADRRGWTILFGGQVALRACSGAVQSGSHPETALSQHASQEAPQQQLVPPSRAQRQQAGRSARLQAQHGQRIGLLEEDLDAALGNL